jgi:hypothetical protein
MEEQIAQLRAQLEAAASGNRGNPRLVVEGASSILEGLSTQSDARSVTAT